MERILIKLKEIQAAIDCEFSQYDFNYDPEGSAKRVDAVIGLLNKAHAVAGYIDWRTQEDLLLNLRQYAHRSYIKVSSIAYLKTCISLIDGLISKLEIDAEFADLIPSQKYYSKNQKFTILKDLDTIFKTAKESIIYYDPYMDTVLVDAMSDLSISEIKLILSSPSEKFKLWVAELNKEKTKNIEYFVLQEKTIHDRYCLIDETELWQISGSINSKRLNSVTVQKIIEETSLQKAISDLSALTKIV